MVIWYLIMNNIYKNTISSNFSFIYSDINSLLIYVRGVVMKTQEEILGKHPSKGLFFNWIECHDTECTVKKRHRYLEEKNCYRSGAIETVARWLIKYHLSKNLYFS